MNWKCNISFFAGENILVAELGGGGGEGLIKNKKVVISKGVSYVFSNLR